MRYKIIMVFIIAIGGGIALSIGYVNPHDGRILLSELILQLSGSRGEYALGYSMSELIAFMMRMIPNYMFQLYFGAQLYCHFCVASIYIFSRYPKRIRWYWKECAVLGIIVSIYEAILLFVSIGVSVLRCRVEVDIGGIVLLIYHFIIYSTWLYSMTLGINLLAMYLGSSGAFAGIMGIQIVSVTLLGSINIVTNLPCEMKLKCGLIKSNMMAQLVLGWHSSSWKTVGQIQNSLYCKFDLNDSVFYNIGVCSVLLLIGAILVCRRELLNSNIEIGGL